MDEVEIEATFDTGETANDVARALNRFVGWLNEGIDEDPPEFFEDFGVEIEEVMENEIEATWDEPPTASAAGNLLVLRMESSELVEVFQELLETLGAYEVDVNEDVESDGPRADDDDDDDTSSRASASSSDDDDEGDDDDEDEIDEDE